MSFTGTVQNGVIHVPPGVELPEGAEVSVEAQPVEKRRTLAERYAFMIGMADDMPSDLAAQVDHYVHGRPKRE